MAGTHLQPAAMLVARRGPAAADRARGRRQPRAAPVDAEACFSSNGRRLRVGVRLQRGSGAPQAGHRRGRGLVRPQDELAGRSKLCVQDCKCDLRKQGASDGVGEPATGLPPARPGGSPCAAFVACHRLPTAAHGPAATLSVGKTADYIQPEVVSPEQLNESAVYCCTGGLDRLGRWAGR